MELLLLSTAESGSGSGRDADRGLPRDRSPDPVSGREAGASQGRAEEASPFADDCALVVRCRAGDELAFASLVRRFHRGAFSTAYRMINDFEDATDVVQEAFLSVHKSISRLREPRAFRAWFMQIVTNLCYSVLRRRAQASVRSLDSAHEEADGLEFPGGRCRVDTPPERARAEELKSRLMKGIERLPPQQKAALVLRTMKNLPFREIGRIMKCSEKTVRAHVFFAREKLRRDVRRYEEGF
ncbi:MAG: sigma-70 family RNA polymerase sigma factor [Planctomycetota bacterium]